MMRKPRWLTAVLTAALLGVTAPAARAAFGVANDCQTPTGTTCWVAGVYNDSYTGMNDRNYLGAPAQQSGGHPFVGVTDFSVTTTSSGAPDGTVKDIRVDIPPGLISNPQAVPDCGDAQLSAGSCPNDTQLGIVELQAWESILGIGTTVYIGTSVYNMAVEPGHCAGYVSDYAFNTPAGRVDICGDIRSTADDGLYFTIAAPQSPQLIRSTLIFWGVPGDTGHDPQRAWSCGVLSLSLIPCSPPASGPSAPAGTPFLSNPSGCLPAGQVSTLTLHSYAGDHAQATSTTPVPAIGCSSVPFDPSLTVTPQTTRSDSPTGLAVDLHVPQSKNPNALASANLKDAAVTLPPGMTLDPSAATGLQACRPAQFGQGSDAAPSCAAASQVGTVEIDTPLLAAPLTGSVYLGCDGASAQTPCPTSTGLAYLYVYAAGQGATQKLLGTVTADPATGRLTTTFADQPQVPFTDFKLDFKGGPTAPVATPLACGAATTVSSLAPYSGNPPATPTAGFAVDSDGAGGPCLQPAAFGPTLAVTPNTNQAGAFDSPLTFDFTRADQQQYLSRIEAQLPPGLLGMISRVPLCPDAQAATGSCPATSRIGTTSVLAGAGNRPITQSGGVFLTGPYGGAPFGLSIVVPAVAGPFDLGTVAVRAAIEVDKATAQITIASDPLPQVVGGVPLRIRGVTVTIDRPGFMLNPTSCAPLATTSALASSQGASATANSPFQATGCGALAFAPQLRVSLTGSGQTTAGRHPALTATVTSSLGQANIDSTAVTLPLSLALDPNNSQHVCPAAAAAADACPARTRIGSATADTPLLNQPLTGPVYLVQGIRTNAQGQQIRTLPAVLVTLRGQVALDLRAQTSVDRHSRLVTTFPAVPDAPMSRFTLQISGGSHGILVVTGHANLCQRAQVAYAALGAHSGAGRNAGVTIATPCPNRARVTGLRVSAHTVRLQVTVPAAGRLQVGGPGLRPATRTLRQAGTVSLILRLTPAATAQLKRTGSVRLRIRIRYARYGLPTQTIVTRSVIIRQSR